MPALGERFRAAREARGLSLSDVAEQIRIRSVYLAAIEDENWSAIGAPVYVRGFLRTYARFLALDSEEAVAAFNGEGRQATPPTTATPSTSYRADTTPSRNLSPLIWIASLVAVALIAFLVYNEATWRQNSSALTATASTTQASEPVATATEPADAGASALPSATPQPLQGSLAQGRSIELHLSAPSWLRVTVDGNVSMEGTFPAGTDRLFHGKNASLRIGNAGGVELVVDGKNIGTLGAMGDVVERTFVL
jgi:cytoskeletal protein RodZ